MNSTLTRNLVSKTISASLLAALFTTARTQAAPLVIPSMTLLATDVNAGTGPSFIVSGNFGPTDTVSERATGTVDLAFGGHIANAAGVILAPATTNLGGHPGETILSSGVLSSVQAPYGAVLIGNSALGFFPLFPADASAGYGSPTAPSDITIMSRSLGSIFGPGFVGLINGTVLQLRINDINTFGNSGGLSLTPVPEPAALSLLGVAMLFRGISILRTRSVRE